MKNCLRTFATWILCFLAFFTITDLFAQAGVRDGFCDYAINASCGIAITNQTTVGGPNSIWEYPQCNDYTFSGPEKIYKFTTTNSGTVQIDLTVHESNLDLDILLLANNCSTPTCLAQSIRNNVNGRTEQIIYNNAPAGTYYLIVDSEKDVGAFDLLISCNTTSGCNLEYSTTAHHISCGGSKGSIDVAIQWGKAPFKIEWDNGNNSVWNTHTTSDKNYTINNLPAGTYIVKITDAMGCVVMKSGIQIKNSSSDLDASFSATNAPCGSYFGWLNIDVANSSPPYWITVTGPKSGTVQGNSNSVVIKDMPPGNYEITVEKGGCSKTGWATISKSPDMDFEVEVSNVSCGSQGAFWVTVKNGSPTYTIEWWHKDGSSDWYQSTSNSFAMNGMKAGEYTIKITDKNGCWKSKKHTMGNGSLDVSLESNPATCGSKGSVWVTINKGTPGYTVEWTGPTTGWKNTDKNSFAIDDLVAGNYEIIIKDAKGCKNTKWITIENNGGSLDFQLESNSASCSSLGSVWVTIKNGTPKYTVEWWGPGISKWATTNNASFQLSDLPGGEYTVKITDANGCSDVKLIKVNETGSDLDFTLETLGATCGEKGSIWIEIKNGMANYSVDVTGPGVNKWFESNSTKIQVTALPAGNYTVEITDAKGCKGTKYITIEDKGGKLEFVTESTNAGCGKNGEIWVTVKNGSPKYIIELWGPNNASFWAETNSSSFKLSELEAGDYTLKITDKNGCSDTQSIKVNGGNSDLRLALEVTNAGCSEDGRLWVTIIGGTPDYHLKWEGPVSGETNLSGTGYQINYLKTGNYTITVKDKNGCSYSKTVSVYGVNNNLGLTIESNKATCSQNGYLWVNISNGAGPYQVDWTGAKSGSMTVSNAGFQISDLPAGNYTINVKDKNGCSVSKQTSIYGTSGEVNFSLEANNGSCGQNGYVWVNISSGTGPYQIYWEGPKNGNASTSSNGYQISNLPSGWYQVTVKDKNGCSTRKDIEVLGSGLFTFTTQQTDAKCGQDGAIWIDINGGKAPFTISLSGPMVGNSVTNDYKYHIPNVPKGNYTLTIKDANGCEVSNYLTIKDTGGTIGLAIETNNATCNQKGSAWLTISGGSAPYTINWSGPVSSSTQTNSTGYQITNLPAGNYTVKVTDNYGCYTDKSITINDTGNSLTLSLEAQSASCGQKGAIGVTIGGGTAPYTISWTGSVNGSVQTSSTSYQITGLDAGTYNVSVTDKNGCSLSKYVSVSNNVQDFSIAVESNDVTCGDKGWAWITMNGGSPNYAISWTGPSSGSANSSNGGYRLDNLVAGTYTITVKESSGCQDSKTIIIYDTGNNLGLGLVVTNATCNGKGAIKATISGGTAGYYYAWSGPVSGSISTSQANYNIDNLPAGTYSVTVRDAKECEITKTVTVQSIGGSLSVDVSTTSNVACEHEGSAVVLIGGGVAPYTINYTGPTNGSVQSNANDYQITGLQPGEYSFSVTDANGCAGSKKVKIYDNGSDLAVQLTASTATCGGKGTIDVNISGGVSNYKISWYGGGLNGEVTTGNTSFVLTDLPVGIYTVEVKDGIGCSVTKTKSVNDSGGSIGLQLSPKNDVCGQGGSIEVRIDGGVANYQIEWSGPISGSATSASNLYQINGLTIVGNYSITVKDANGCEAKEWVAINTGGAVNLNLVSTNVNCNQSGDILVNILSGSPNYTISWTGPSSGSQATNTNVYKIANLSEGTYSVTVKDSKGCDKTESVSISNEGSTLGLTLTNANTTCGESNGNITATVSNGQGAYTFSWTGPVSGSTSVSSNSYSIWDLPAGIYTISVLDKNGCKVSKTIQINSTGNDLGLSVVGKNAACGQPSGIQVTISNGVPNFKIEWTGPANGTNTTSNNSYTINSVPDGEYVVSVTDASGCSKAQAVIIQSNPNDVNFTYEVRDVACENKGAIWLTIKYGNGPYNISWSGPSSGASTSTDEGVQITDLVAGVYAVTVSDKNGCVITQSIEVKNTGGGATINFAYKSRAATCNENGNILITMITGTAPYTVSWSGPSSGSRTVSTSEIKIEDLVIGIYKVTVTGAGGCGTQTQDIQVEDKRVVLGVNGTVSNGVCGGKGSVHLSWSGDRDPYTVSWSGAAVGSIDVNANSYTINNLNDGAYTFKVVGYDGCEGQYQATINNSGTSVTSNFSYAVNARKLTFTNLSSAGNYLWNFGDGNTSTEMNPIHTYEKNDTYTICLKVTNDCGTKEKCKAVTINAITSQDPSAKVVLGEKSGAKNTVLQLPVRIENCRRIGTLSGTIMLGNSNAAKINGISPSTISPVYNSGNYSFSYLSSGSGMDITSETVLFYINVQLIGSVGESSTIDLTSLPVTLELTCTENGFSNPITPGVGSGRVSISTSQLVMTEVGGNIKTYWGDGIGDAMVTIKSAEHEMNPLTAVDGDYRASDVPMGYEYTIFPSKNTNPSNGLSTYGLFLTQKYILGFEPDEIVSPYQLIAMDANCSGSLTTFDLFVMQQLLVGNLTEFPGCESWVFVDANHEFETEFDSKNVFPYPNAHTMMLDKEDAVADFIGIKVGDVLGRALPNYSNLNTSTTNRSRKVIPLQINQNTAEIGQVFEVNFRANDLEDLASYQLGLDYNYKNLEFLDFKVNPNLDLSSTMVGVNKNQLKISWYDGEGNGLTVKENAVLFTLKFKAKQKIDDLVEEFSINNETFNSELHTSTQKVYQFELTQNRPIKSALIVHQNTPNPFKDNTFIGIESPTKMDAVIILHDHFGRTIQILPAPLTQGFNRIRINRNQLSSGVYYYTVKSGDNAITKRMLVVE